MAVALLAAMSTGRDEESLRTERDRLLQLAAVGEVLPSLLHELRNPIASVTVALEVLIEELPPGEVQDTLHALLGELRRAQLTLQGIGTAANCSLNSEGSHQVIDLALEDACRVMSANAREAGIDLRVHVDAFPLLPLNAASLRGVLFNLLHNAIAATSRGGFVEVRGHLEGSVLRVVVEDSGVGMTPEVLARCTETFFTTKARGSGIGLALAKRTVESVGGWIDISSEPGEGTSVELWIPIAERVRRTSAPPPERRSSPLATEKE
ncbi:MAG: HAMP domain-containing sensor histidine kinase [Polyangiales bacterium]